jgi:cytochrome c biogenesis protein
MLQLELPVALILLMLMGVAAIPGSLIPQRITNPMAVRDFFTNNPGLSIWYDRLSLFDVYGSPWFSAIYILLFIFLFFQIPPLLFLKNYLLASYVELLIW